MLKRSVKTDVLIFLSVLTTISIAVTAYIGIYSTITIGEDAEQTTANALRAHIEETLTQFAVLASEKNDAMLEDVRKTADSLAAYTKNIFDNPEIFNREAYWKFDDHIFRGSKGQYLNGKDDISSVFIPNQINTEDKNVREEVELTAYLDLIFQKFLENNPEAVAIWTIGIHETSRYYPNIGLANILPPDLITTEEIFFTVANPENNPERKVVWTPVYDDPAGQGLMITASAPIYTKQKEFVGVLGIDVTLNTMIKNIEEYKPIEDSYAFLIDKDGYSIAMSEDAYKDILGRNRGSKELRVNLNDVSNEFSPVINEMKKGSSGFQNIKTGNKELYVAYAPLRSSEFSLGMVGEKTAILKAVSELRQKVKDSAKNAIYLRILPIGLLILFSSLASGFLFTKKTIEPIKKLTSLVKEVSENNLDKKIEVRSKNELGQLAESFNSMMENLRSTTTSISRLNVEIAERKKAEESTKHLNNELEQTVHTLEAVNTELKDFVYIASHDLREPLRKISSFGELLKDSLADKLEDDDVENFEFMIDGADRMTKMIEGLLVYSRLNKDSESFEAVDLNEIIEQLKQLELNISLAETGAMIEVSENMPKVLGDETQLKQILQNFISNGIKYRAKDVQPRITITARQISERKVKVEVRDNGIGIEEKYYTDVFKMFRRLHSRQEYEGTGIGLAVCRKIIDKHHGQIGVESEAGKGSTFWFILPMATAEQQEHKNVGSSTACV